MNNTTLDILKLGKLYLQKLSEESFCNEFKVPRFDCINAHTMINGSLSEAIYNCASCARAKLAKERCAGLINTDSKICFITQNPLIKLSKSNIIFRANQSADTLQKIITNVFNLALNQCDILSVMKCHLDNTPSVEEAKACMEFLSAQLLSMTPRILLVFGKAVSAQILGEEMSANTGIGRALSYNQHTLFITYSINEILRNPALKKEMFEHLKLAKSAMTR